MCECFITSDKDKAYIDYVGYNYLIIKDIFTDDPVKISISEQEANFWKEELSDQETSYVFYDKEKKILL
ncbi:hypothetical protein [Terrisporobacter muris]|uniref:Uncharacterized protein n=1 Tax=Terrisporobacter muris TaxID=2963284 RepID=A0A9X2MGQ0_9FIRM|nr:hypothetical protein [Terrisporobacter muris]MCR1823806.1 hypothetical protein [Terrisporobacter muris]